MFLCYFDESGDGGAPAPWGNSSTKAFALGCLIVKDTVWLAALDDFIGYRRFLRESFGIQPRIEVKAATLAHNSGPIRKLRIGDLVRQRIYRQSMKLPTKLGNGQGIHTFGVVVDKAAMNERGDTENPQRAAWERAIERLERFSVYNKDFCLVVPDDGTIPIIQSIVREKRRFSYVGSHYGTSALPRPASLVIEDPVPRNSRDSFFIQQADLIAYAAYHAVFPSSGFGAADYWDELAETRVAAVNKYSGGPTGIVVWKGRKK